MREATFSAALRKKLTAEGIYCLKLNLAFTAGVADCWYSGSQADMWSEHKYLQALPKRVAVQATKLLTPLQQLWLEQRHMEGRNVAVIIGSPQGHLFLPELSWQVPVFPKDARLLTTNELIEQLVAKLGANKKENDGVSPTRNLRH